MNAQHETQSETLWGRYTDLRPDSLAHIRAHKPIVYMPWGALDWHGPHLPFGADGFVAEAMAEHVAQRVGGVLLPTTWWPGSTLPHQRTLAVRSNVIRELWRDLFNTLAEAEWRVVLLVNGYYTEEHELVLMETAEEAIRQHGLLVLALPPLSLIDDSLIDHGALWETSLLLSLCPGLVDLYALGDGELTPVHSAVRGRDPRGAASASLGDTVMHLTIERVVTAVNDLLTNRDPAPLHVLYEERRELIQRRKNGRETPARTQPEPDGGMTGKGP
jgi:creatinine amidohydrolase